MHSYSIRRINFEYTDEYFVLLKKILKSDEESIILDGITAISNFTKSNRKLAIELLRCVNIGKSIRVADNFFLSLNNSGFIPFESLHQEEIEFFLNKLMPLDTLDGYWLETFLANASKNYPLITAAFLRKRVENGQDKSYVYRSCNYGPYVNVPLVFRESPEFRTVLRQSNG